MPLCVLCSIRRYYSETYFYLSLIIPIWTLSPSLLCKYFHILSLHYSSLESRIICLSYLIHFCICHHNECKVAMIVGFHHSGLFKKTKKYRKSQTTSMYVRSTRSICLTIINFNFKELLCVVYL